MASCGICGRTLSVEGDALSTDCGGDCWGCIGRMEADGGHPDSVARVAGEVRRGARPPSLARVAIDTADGNVTVMPVWSDVDRPSTMGYCLRPDQGALAERLAAAMRTGDAFSGPVAATDIDGRSYVSAELRFNYDARRLDADLRAIGH